MTFDLRAPVLLALLFCAALGCSQETEQAQPPTPTVQRPTRSIQDPLTEQEVQTFLSVLASLPGNRAPEFEPLAQATASEEMSAAQLAQLYRTEFRAMFDASRHGERWRSSEDLMTSFVRHDVTPEDFAALMIRMSCAVTASSLSPQVDLQNVARDADQQVATLTSQIDQLDRGARTMDSINRRRQSLEALQHLVAFSEFTRILMEVPDTSCQIVARHRAELAGHLPETGGVEQFERTIQAGVVPTSFQQTAPTEQSAP